MRRTGRELVILNGDITSPPMSPGARWATGNLLRKLQHGNAVSLPHSRPMPSVGPHCHELRVNDTNQTWRVIYRIDEDAIVVAEVFSKKTAQTPPPIIDACKNRYRRYDAIQNLKE